MTAGTLPVRGALLWASSASLLLSAWAVWWPQPLAGAGAGAGDAGVAIPAQAPLAPSATAPSLPAMLTALSIEPSQDFDPFAGPASPTPTPLSLSLPVPKPSAPPLPAQEMSPPTTLPPPVNHRILGRMADPSGTVRVYLEHGEQALPLAVGQVLDGGYVVTAIGEESITLGHPSLSAAASIPIPTEGDPGRR